MRRRNRKRVRLRTQLVPFRFAGGVVLLALVALAYVWIGHCEQALGREYKALERTREELKKKRLNEEYKWARTKSPRNIALALERFNAQMTWPLRAQVVHLREIGEWDGADPIRAQQFERMARND